MSNNPFAKFGAGTSKVALSQPAAGGWMATKRRGRDDDEIEKDRERAVQARKKSKKTTTDKVVVSEKKQTKKKKKADWSDDEDDEDDDFIVDDEEVQEHWSEDEADLIVLEPRRRPVNKPPQRKNRHSNDDEDDELIDTPKSKTKSRKQSRSVIDSDDDEEEEFLGDDEEDEEEELESLLPAPDKKRISVPPKNLSSKFFPKKKKVLEFSDSESSDGSGVVELNRRSKTNVARKSILDRKKANTTKTIELTSSEEDEPPKKKKTNNNNNNKRVNDTVELASPDEKDKRFKKKKRTIIQVDSDDEGVFSPLDKKKATVVSSTDSSTNVAFFKDSDDDKTPTKRSAPSSSRNKKIDFGDDDMDDDERMAIAVAMSASQADQRQSLLLSEDEEAPVEEEDEDDEGDDASHVDETGDHRREAASKVLATANKLSQQVLQNMMAWSSECQGAAATQGMIVEGALAMNTFDAAPTSNWISQERMKEICPLVKLADYQLIGVNWLALLHEMKVDIGNGEKSNVNGILADVMGLGKTVQTIAFMAWLRSKNRGGTGNDISDVDDSDDEGATAVAKPRVKPHVVIVPASVLDNWMCEFAKFAPQLVVVKYHGPMAAREQLRIDLERQLPRRKKQNNAACDVDVVLTTFSYFSGQKADDRMFLRRFDFDYMVIDEAHVLKNPDSNAYQNIDKFETAHRLLLTGTPVQNSPKELMSLICFLMPLFKTANKASWDEDGKKNDGGASMLEHFVSLEGEGDANSDEAAYKKLKHLFAPFVLRRRKEDVLSQSMPPKTRELLRVPLSPAIRKLYNSILASHLKAKGDKKSIAGDAKGRLHLFSTLRKVANHPLLLRNRHVTDEAIEHLSKHLRMYGYFGSDESCTLTLVKQEVERLSDFAVHHAVLDVIDENNSRKAEMARYVLKENDLFCSPKLEKLRTLIPDLVDKGHRILIFSQWTSCLDLLGCLLESLGLNFFRLDGQTPIATRQEMINNFNEDETIPVFLLSTKAGGMGINLTAADVCILHDLDFNPFNDLQAEDRCHRIGQTKPVRVIKMVTMHTVDDDIYKMQQRKTKMNAAILEKGGSIESSEEKKRDNAEIKSMLQNQLDRYLSNKNGGEVSTL